VQDKQQSGEPEHKARSLSDLASRQVDENQNMARTDTFIDPLPCTLRQGQRP